uniref:DNA-directed RNA polymerase subunit n=1 Tax=Corethron hystrix TaxID=216773 RepID=A0A7S1FQE6_9STRA|mmetsp:Transcript_19449/g.44297  ORF Transcript_19449/g.44297 Transcript_19449/m.44297 type:complete len:128 (+) Transcript_19449:55-438(+)
MWFCPLDGTLLQISSTSNNGSNSNAFACRTCRYVCEISKGGSAGGATSWSGSFRSSMRSLKAKAVDDILGGAAAWENVDQTAAVCPRPPNGCGATSAYFMQIQIRSADEPMSVFYKCVGCGHQWNDK